MDQSKQQDHHPHKTAPSKAEILSGAKVLADAARKKEKMDKAKVAGAAANLLGAASHYGKLEEKGVGKYVNKAEDYLRQYNSSHAPSTAAAATTPTADQSPPAHSGTGQSGGGGYGDYIKLAEGLLKKQSGGGGGGNSSTAGQSAAAGGGGGGAHGSGGFGDYLKLAEGFLKKH